MKTGRAWRLCGPSRKRYLTSCQVIAGARLDFYNSFMEKNIFIKGNIFEWAVRESQIPIELVRDKFRFVEAIEKGEGITYSQAKSLSGFLKIPFGFLFLDNPLSEDGFLADFRTIGNKKNNEISKNLKDVLLEMDYKKNWMSSYRRSTESEEIPFLKSLDLFDNVRNTSNKIRELLGIELEWYKNTGKVTTFQYLKNIAETLGFIVMSSGIVGQNTRRKLDINEFRGFALFDEFAPLIFINSADNENAECFTLLHEMIHLLTTQDDDIVSNGDERIERAINAVTAEILMPQSVVLKKTSGLRVQQESVHKLAQYFSVNDLAMANRLYSLKLLDHATFDLIKERLKAVRASRKSGGNYYSTYKNRNSVRFVMAVFDSIYARQTTYTEGFRLLGVNSKTFKQVEMLMGVRA